MVAAMAFPTRYNYLSRIGALSPMAINVLLRGVVSTSSFIMLQVETHKQVRKYGLAHFRSPQILCATQIRRQKTVRQTRHRQIAGMESGRSVFRDRRAGSRPRP